MINKIRNIDPRTKLVAKAVAVRIVLPVAAVVIAQVVANRLDKNKDEEN